MDSLGTLDAFNGEVITGTWNLLIADTFLEDSLRFNSATLSITPTPEPSAALLLGIGLIGLVGYGGRVRKQSNYN